MRKPITPRGYSKMREELKRLKAMRPEIANAIEIARGHGDLSENGDYDAAKNKSGMVEAKIRDLETKLSHAQVVDPRSITNLDKVVFGLTVAIEDVDSGEKKTLSIYGADESDIEKGWISFESPLAKGLIGKALGDIAKIELPGGIREYEVMEILIDYSDDGAISDE